MSAAFKTLLVFIGLFFVLITGYLVYMFNNPTGFSYITKKNSLGFNYVYELEMKKDQVFKRLNPSHEYSDTHKNLTDSLFVLYFNTGDFISINALVRIIAKDKTKTIIKLDSITGYTFPAFLDSTEINKSIGSYDSLGYTNLFDKFVVQIIKNDSLNNDHLSFDNKLILDQYQ